MERLVLNQKGIGEVAATEYTTKGYGSDYNLACVAVINGIHNADGSVIGLSQIIDLQSVNPSDIKYGEFYVAHEYTPE